jgi:leader peptidase (prepilin peptidase)/N-methyltransferase
MIPNSFFVMFLGLSVAALITRFIQVRDLHVFLAPFAVALPFLLAFIVTKGKALGFGDVLMYMAVGAFLGLEQGLAVLFISVWLGGVTGLVLHFLSKKKYTMKSALPFVPFITLAFVIVLFTDIDIISIGGLLTRWYY